MPPTSNNVIYRGYSDSSPYPPIKVQSPNRQYADLLMEDFAGSKGEFTAMSLYFYQHYITKENLEDYSIMTMRIAIAEMHHMDILSSVILNLGGKPIFSDSTYNGKLWTARNVFYGTDLCEGLDTALKGEIGAIETYEKHINMIDDPYIKIILERIILDEQLHKSYIERSIAAYCK